MYPALPIQRPADAAAAACRSGGPDREAALEPGMTWYDVLGALPGAEPRRLRAKYDARAALIRPELIAGAPPGVLTAVLRAQDLLDTAWRVLGDPAGRRRYDQAMGFRRSGGGLGQALAGRPGPRRRRRTRPGPVPDVRGLFFPVGLEVAGRRGLQVRIVQLTEHAMAVDGLVVDQHPRPPAKARRGGTLTVQVWHPPARPRP